MELCPLQMVVDELALMLTVGVELTVTVTVLVSEQELVVPVTE